MLTRPGYIAIPTYSGLLFAEMSSFSSTRKFTASRSLVKRTLVALLFLSGLYLMSMPSVNWEWAPWFHFILEDFKFLFPEGSNVYVLTSYIGVFLTLLSILVSTDFQNVLTHPICLWLGQLSLPIYLIHGPIIRTLFCWLIYGFTQPEYREERDANGNIERIPGNFPSPSSTRVFVSIAIFFGVVLCLSQLWSNKVEPWCAKVAKYVEDIITGKRELLLRFIDSREDTAEY
jgi:transcription initiation factor TFIID subunit 11